MEINVNVETIEDLANFLESKFQEAIEVGREGTDCDVTAKGMTAMALMKLGVI